MRKVGPGVYIDREGALHLSARELCESLGVPWSEHNGQIIFDQTLKILRDKFKFTGTVEERMDDADPS